MKRIRTLIASIAILVTVGSCSKKGDYVAPAPTPVPCNCPAKPDTTVSVQILSAPDTVFFREIKILNFRVQVSVNNVAQDFLGSTGSVVISNGNSFATEIRDTLVAVSATMYGKTGTASARVVLVDDLDSWISERKFAEESLRTQPVTGGVWSYWTSTTGDSSSFRLDKKITYQRTAGHGGGTFVNNTWGFLSSESLLTMTLGGEPPQRNFLREENEHFLLKRQVVIGGVLSNEEHRFARTSVPAR